MSDKKLITVFGATGSQGGGLARAILNDPDSEFKVRALTRDPGSAKARALADMGAEVMKVDNDNYEDIRRSLEGAYGAYFVTFYWAHMSPEKEIAHIEYYARAAKDAGLKHAIWSTLEDTRKWIPLDDDRMPTLKEKYKVPHFDTKGSSNKFFHQYGVPTTKMCASFYWDNLYMFGMGPKKGEDGVYNFVIPMGDKKLPGIAAEDIGKCAYGIFQAGDQYIGETVGIAGEHLTGREMADRLTESYGEKVRYAAVPFDTYRSFGFPGADDLGNMFQFHHDFNDEFLKARDVDVSRQLNPELQTFRDWLDEYADRIPKE